MSSKNRIAFCAENNFSFQTYFKQGFPSNSVLKVKDEILPYYKLFLEKIAILCLSILKISCLIVTFVISPNCQAHL